MENTYKHGTYGYLGETQAKSAAQSGTIAAYVGTAPVNLVRDYKAKGIVNAPVRLTNYTQAQRVIGYSPSWNQFTLCEAVSMHLNNRLGNCGPIYVVNVLDPDIHRKTQKETRTLTFTNGRAEFLSDDIILDTFAIEDKAEGIDYNLSYNFTKGSVIVTLTNSSEETINTSYFAVDSSKIQEADIVGGVTSDGKYSGIAAINLLYMREFQVATLLGAPGWSHLPAVYKALVSLANGVNRKWLSFVVADISVADTDTIAKAIAWRNANGYTSRNSKVCWPMGKDAEGNVFHVSTSVIWQFQRTDAANKGIPGETCSNKEVPFIRQYFGEGSANQGFDQADGNELNEHGITTIVPFNSKWVIWGGHTAAYEYGVTSDALEIFDTNIRMLSHCANSYQMEWAGRIDRNMTIQLRDEILNRENDKLAGYVASGFLLGNPVCIFDQSENSDTDLMNGDFTWHISATPTPQFKSGAVGVSYTDDGLKAYFA